MAKKKNTENSRKYSKATRREKLRYLKVLDQNGMNITLSAKQLGISRQTLYTYHKDYWDEYTGIKSQVFDDSATVSARKLEESVELSIIQGKISDTFDRIIGELDRRLQNPEEAKKIYTKDLIQAANVMVPYMAEKKILLGARANEQSGGTTMFVQNIVNQIVGSQKNRKVEDIDHEGIQD
jgi:hypothetical protein